MTYQPYPNAERARRQVERHDYETPPLTAARPPSLLERKLADAFAPLLALKKPRPLEGKLAAALAGAFAPPVDEYRLSSRPRIVSGGS